MSETDLDLIEFEKRLPPIDTPESKCLRHNLRRIKQLRPNGKRPPGGQLKLPIITKKMIVDTKNQYLQIEKYFTEPQSQSQDVDQRLQKVLKLVLDYITEKELSKLCCLSTSMARFIIDQDFVWRKLMNKRNDLLPVSSHVRITSAMQEYKLSHYWTKASTTTKTILKFNHPSKSQNNHSVDEEKKLNVIYDRHGCSLKSPCIIYPVSNRIYQTSEKRMNKPGSSDQYYQILAEFDCKQNKKFETMAINKTAKSVLIGSSSGEVTVLCTQINKRSFMQKIITEEETSELDHMTLSIEDIHCQDNYVSIACSAGVIKLFQLADKRLSLLQTMRQRAQFVTLSKKYQAVTDKHAGTNVTEIETGTVVTNYSAFKTVKPLFQNQNICMAKKVNVHMKDLRVADDSGVLFNGSQTTRFMEYAAKIIGNDISSIFVDDVKLLAGNAIGDIILWDLRNNSKPLRLWGTGAVARLGNTASIKRNGFRVRIESLDVSPTKVFAMSRIALNYVKII